MEHISKILYNTGVESFDDKKSNDIIELYKNFGININSVPKKFNFIDRFYCVNNYGELVCLDFNSVILGNVRMMGINELKSLMRNEKIKSLINE